MRVKPIMSLPLTANGRCLNSQWALSLTANGRCLNSQWALSLTANGNQTMDALATIAGRPGDVKPIPNHAGIF
jgi:hypothetical protein